MAEILNVLLEGTGRRLSNRLEGAIMGQQNQRQPAQRKVFAESRGAARKIGMTEDNAMFHITLITVGKLKERYYAAAADEYIRRLGAYCKFELIELPECRLPDRSERDADRSGPCARGGADRGKAPARRVVLRAHAGGDGAFVRGSGRASAGGKAQRPQRGVLSDRLVVRHRRAHQAHGGFPPVVQQNDVPAPPHARHGARAALPRGEHPGRDEIS